MGSSHAGRERPGPCVHPNTPPQLTWDRSPCTWASRLSASSREATQPSSLPCPLLVTPKLRSLLLQP